MTLPQGWSGFVRGQRFYGSPNLAYLVVSHALAAEVLHGSGWSSDPLLSPSLAGRFQGGAGNGLVAKSLLFSDLPGHTRLRKALNGWLTPRAVEGSRPRIAAIARAALAGHDAGEPLEVMENLAYAVPLAVICELLDAPAEAGGTGPDCQTLRSHAFMAGRLEFVPSTGHAELGYDADVARAARSRPKHGPKTVLWRAGACTRPSCCPAPRTRRTPVRG
jgi:cytochrome P450